MPRFEISLPQGTMSVWHQTTDRPRGDKPIFHWAHATGFNGATYNKLLAPLADEIDIFAADARGHGFTTLPADPTKLTNWNIFRDDLEPLIETLAEQAGQKIWLGGHSKGGCESVMLAAKRPDLVAGLVLADPVIMPAWPRWVLRLLVRVAPRLRQNLAPAAARRRPNWPNVAAVKTSYQGRGAFKTWQDGFLDDYLAGGLRPIETDADGNKVTLACAPHWEAVCLTGPQTNSIKPIKNLRVPFTLLMAEFNSTTRAPQVFERVKVDKKIETVRGTTHFLPMEQPEKLRAEIRARLGLKN